MGPGLLWLTSLQLTFHWQECNPVATLSARESGKCSPAGLLFTKKGRMDLGRQLTVSPQKMESIFICVCSKMGNISLPVICPLCVTDSVLHKLGEPEAE